MRQVPTSKTPKILQTLQWIFDPVGYSKESYKLGDMFQPNIFSLRKEKIVVINEPSAIQYLLTHDSGKEFSLVADGKLFIPLIGQNNLMMMTGKEHRKRRNLIMPFFHSESVVNYGLIIQNITENVIKGLPDDRPLIVSEIMYKITLRVILQVVFGLYQGDRYEQLEGLLNEYMKMTTAPIAALFIFLPRLQKILKRWKPVARSEDLVAQMDSLIFDEINKRRAKTKSERNDILSLLLTAKDDEGNGLTDQELRDELMSLLVAGYSTTSMALEWAIYWAYSQPDIKQKLLSELNTVTDLNDQTKIFKLPYLSAFCNETLRIYPVTTINFTRQVNVPVEISGYQLQPGTLVMCSIYLLHHREELYPQPEQFNPDRFLEKQFSPYEFMPFGGGERRCIGSALALYEMKIVLKTILTQVDLKLLNSKPVLPRRVRVGLGPNTPVQVQKL